MLEGLDTLNWEELQDGWGADTPDQIRALASPEKVVRERALARLYTTIYHQGSVFLVSVKAVPFLIELLKNDVVQDKHRILMLLLHLAMNEPHGFLGDPGAIVNVANLPTQEQSGKHAPSDPADVFDWTAAAVRDGSETYVKLLWDEDAHVRAAAAFLLGFVGHPVSAIAPRVRARIADETEPRAKASEIIGLAMLELGDASSSDTSLFEAALEPSNPPIVRLSAAIALAYALGQNLPEEARHALSSATTSPPEDPELFPPNKGDIAKYAAKVLKALDGV